MKARSLAASAGQSWKSAQQGLNSPEKGLIAIALHGQERHADPATLSQARCGRLFGSTAAFCLRFLKNPGI